MPTTSVQGERLVILGVAESDAHAVANRLLERELTEHGYHVVNLGVCTPLTEFARAYDAHPSAEAVLIGSLNGHAHADLRDLPELRASGALRCPIVVGGNISVGSRKDGSAEGRLRALGVDYVVREPAELLVLLDMLRAAAGTALAHD